MPTGEKTKKEILAENERLRLHLEEAEDAQSEEAIRRVKRGVGANL